ncbi:NAD+-dependent protein deacetylase SIR2 [Nematocida sp. LUAm3]|nr:NAD+-dependent protein deacetylase SIR2 [Nematocida sp. LUAm3]KAI5175835.1 NAD+-dependent protein deacetylase SIR2 [Nematocida sp. LUAm2]KAI5178331.1 NAD+-dependent protein deacetylase SIR2 [Nematocida sp. LUAm1]
MKRLCASSSSVYLKLASLMRKGGTSAVLGAGVSTSSGISDFRSKTGFFKEIKRSHGVSGEEIFSCSIYRDEEIMDIFLKTISHIKDISEEASPSDTHKLVYYLQKKHKCTIYTQNIDGLEKKAGVEKNIVYLHGNLDYLKCTHCMHISPYTQNENKLIKTNIPINCGKCTERREKREEENKRKTPIGRFLPNIVLYGKQTDTLEVIKKVDQDKKNEILLVIGTSLRVHGVKNLVRDLSKSVRKNQGISIYVGIEEPPKQMSTYFDYWIEGKADTFSSSLLSALHGGFALKYLQKSSLSIDSLMDSMRRLSLDIRQSEAALSNISPMNALTK